MVLGMKWIFFTLQYRWNQPAEKFTRSNFCIIIKTFHNLLSVIYGQIVGNLLCLQKKNITTWQSTRLMLKINILICCQWRIQDLTLGRAWTLSTGGGEKIIERVEVNVIILRVFAILLLKLCLKLTASEATN